MVSALMGMTVYHEDRHWTNINTGMVHGAKEKCRMPLAMLGLGGGEGGTRRHSHDPEGECPLLCYTITLPPAHLIKDVAVRKVKVEKKHSKWRQRLGVRFPGRDHLQHLQTLSFWETFHSLAFDGKEGWCPTTENTKGKYYFAPLQELVGRHITQAQPTGCSSKGLWILKD